MIQLRGGAQTADRRLDRVKQFDPRSRGFGIMDAIPGLMPGDGRSWAVSEHLDQGREGACVGFGVTHELAAYPRAVPALDAQFANAIYREARKIDPWPGEDYEGTSVLAGVKVAQRLGYFREYRWCFSVEEIMLAVAHEGPVVVGTNWHESMYEPDASGRVHITGEPIGGHCYLIRGIALNPRGWGLAIDEPVLRFRNSWGPDWGRNGDGFITVSDWREFLHPEGEAVVFMGRHKRPQVASFATERQPVTEPHHWHA